jgi:opacity protein-like surface antigen
MKKIFIAAVLAVTVAGSAFAADASKLSYRIKSSFEILFNGAKDVNWTVRESFTKANFTLAGEKVEAFFSPEGELIATARKVQYGTLPYGALKKIEKKYPQAQVEETIELDRDGDKSYFVSLHDNGKKEILQVTLAGAVVTFNGKQ